MLSPSVKRCAAASILVFACLALSATNGAAHHSFNTKGTPLKGQITDSTGNVIATSEFFGEGTTRITFDSRQRLITGDKTGKVIAGFEYTAVDPKKSKFTEVFWFAYKEGDKKKWLVLEHTVAKMTFRKGRFRVTDPDVRLLTNFWKGDEQMIVQFKEVKHDIKEDGRVVNRLILRSPEGESFEFEIEDSRPPFHYLKSLKGDIIAYLKAKGAHSPRQHSTNK